ncbi:MAG: hypothetical protein H7A23_19935 [Leptospiraceae bacterium]|nr:hypothetical protein [Leptospiraceae bacterium]MCP5496828.1 hypothetical protein [Leptospiraceae bacterium]
MAYNTFTNEKIIEQFGLTVVTTGLEWRFLQLAGNILYIQHKSYELENLETILGVLYKMVTE